MYYPNQVVFDLDSKEPVKCGGQGWQGHPVKRTTHFICGFRAGYQIAFPTSLEEAKTLLEQGRIQPAPIRDTHCHKCTNWLSNHNPDGSCWS